MDVTPHDLRNAELREAFRGYRPDEVEELLERAAVTLERMHERARLLQERIGQVEQEAANGREMESVLRQTLLLAQRTADETVTSAHEKARQLVEEAEDRALAMTTEADEQARSLGEAQQQKYDAIVAELSARRDMLTVDIDALERVQADYRGRLRAVLERELEDLERRAELPPPHRPELHEIDLAQAEAEPEAQAEPESGSEWAPDPAAAESAAVPAGDATRVGHGNGNGNGNGTEAEGGPPTEALVVIDDELADNGRPGPAARRRS
ncbi:MAG: DivIVA domain-containing protein [Acidimicrobiia bacterium]